MYRPSTLLPAGIDQFGVPVTDLETGIKDADIVMMLRLQTEHMQGAKSPASMNISICLA